MYNKRAHWMLVVKPMTDFGTNWSARLYRNPDFKYVVRIKFELIKIISITFICNLTVQLLTELQVFLA